MTQRAHLIRRRMVRVLAQIDLEFTFLMAMIATAIAAAGLTYVLRGLA